MKSLDLFSSVLVDTDTGPVLYTSEEPVDLDDYDDGPHLHLVDPPPPTPHVIVEAVGEDYEVSRLRDNGSTVACVRWTRAELEELIGRAQAALKVT